MSGERLLEHRSMLFRKERLRSIFLVKIVTIYCACNKTVSQAGLSLYHLYWFHIM